MYKGIYYKFLEIRKPLPYTSICFSLIVQGSGKCLLIS